MQTDKLNQEVISLYRFFKIYCDDKHINQELSNLQLSPKENYDFELCPECFTLISYSIHRLKACTLDPKPKCRNCKDNCYELQERRQMGKIMKYSGIKLGLSRIKKIFMG